MGREELATEEVTASSSQVQRGRSLLTRRVYAERLLFPERGSRGSVFFFLAEDKPLKGVLLQADRLMCEEPALRWGEQEVN